ncbi:MAG TPA: cytochrome c biogenesis protein CcdA [Oscillospiraceae bacterium]|nr:cytochrome c biogenesis protein CcdA [Oscillospiraceae bacterium]
MDSSQWLQSLATMIAAKMWLAPLFAFAAGVLTSFTPCALSSIPLVISYVGSSGEGDTKNAFWLSAIFALGSAVTFTILGAAASLLGRLMQSVGSWWYLVLGVLMLLMALQTWEIFSFIPSSYAVSRNKQRGFGGAFVAGILGGFFSSPCSTPVLVVLLAFVAQEGSLLWGVVLLLLYSLGHSLLVLLAGTSIVFVQKLSRSDKYGKFSNILRILMGTLMTLIALYMFYLGF